MGGYDRDLNIKAKVIPLDPKNLNHSKFRQDQTIIFPYRNVCTYLHVHMCQFPVNRGTSEKALKDYFPCSGDPQKGSLISRNPHVRIWAIV